MVTHIYHIFYTLIFKLNIFLVILDNLECCGFSSSSDYLMQDNATAAANSSENLPLSCCKEKDENEFKCTVSLSYKIGCNKKYESKFSFFRASILFLIAFSLFLQLMIIIITLYFLNSVVYEKVIDIDKLNNKSIRLGYY